MLRKLMEERDRGYDSENLRERFRDFMRFERGGNSGGSYSGGSGSRRHHDSFDDLFEDDFSRYRRRREGFGEMDESRYRRMFDDMGESEKREMWESIMGSQEGMRGRHFSSSNARYEVSEMCHTENGNKHKGEKFSMEKAEEVFKRYKSILPEETTVADVYVAINCHFHDFAKLYKSWFGDNIDTKVIESAIIFWFKDEEFPEGDKLWKYFKKMK